MFLFKKGVNENDAGSIIGSKLQYSVILKSLSIKQGFNASLSVSTLVNKKVKKIADALTG